MGKIAFVFAGQGAQYPGMGKDLYDNSAAAKGIFDLCDSILPGNSGMCFGSDPQALNQTVNTQPALFAVDLACAEALREEGIKPAAVAGFSLGEVPAVAFSGMLTASSAFEYVCKRAEYMSDSSRKIKGAMAAVLRMENREVEEICKGYEGIYPVNYNCPGQLVVAGTEKEIDRLIEDMPGHGGKAMKLKVSGAFHTPFMDEASYRLHRILKSMKFSESDMPVYSNVNARIMNKAEAAGLMSLQVMSPVRWEDTVRNMFADGIDTFIEVGPGKVLSGLIGKILKGENVNILNAEKFEDIKACLAVVNQTNERLI